MVPNSLYKQSMERTSLYQTTVPLRSGVYKVELVLKDLNSGNVGTIYRSIRVPKFPEDQLSTSSIILADKIEGLPIYQASAGPFILGGAKVGTVAASMANQMYNVQYPPAAATGMILLLAVLLLVGGIMRMVDVRRQL